MTENTGSTRAITHYKRTSWQSKLAENSSLFIVFSTVLISAILLGLISAFCAPFLFGHKWLALLIFLLCTGTAVGISMVLAARFVDRRLFGGTKATVLAIEESLIAGNARTKMNDLEQLVSGYLKLKRLEAADYYSKKLLEISKTGGSGEMSLSDWLVTTECWVSTEKYHKSWSYNLVWLFETRGVLTLSPDRLDFQSRHLHFACSPASIVSVELHRHPLWQKPIPMRFIKLVIDELGQRHTFNLTPSFSQTDTVFDCNAMVDIWFERLQKMRRRLNPSGAFPDWLSDLKG